MPLVAVKDIFIELYDEKDTMTDKPSPPESLDAHTDENFGFDAFLDQAIQERIEALDSSQKETLDKTMVEAEIIQTDVQTEVQVETVVVARANHDPYAGYLAPNGRNKKQRTKKKPVRVQQQEINQVLDTVFNPATQFNGVTVSYSEMTMPPDMKK